MSDQPAFSSLACVREVKANFSRLGMGSPGQTLVDWAWDTSRANSSQLGMGPPGQTPVDWAFNLQGKQAVEKSWLVEEEMLLRQESR